MPTVPKVSEIPGTENIRNSSDVNIIRKLSIVTDEIVSNWSSNVLATVSVTAK